MSHHISHQPRHHGRYDGSGIAEGYRCVEVISGARRRRDWSDEEKLAIIAESFSTRTSISSVARRHGINKNQLFQWRRQFRDGAFEQKSDSVEFVPVVSDGGTGDEAGAAIAPPLIGAIAAGACSAMIEIVIGATTVRVPPSADERALRRILAAVRDLP